MILVNPSIHIAGFSEPIPFSGININSFYNDHHNFQIFVPLTFQAPWGISEIKTILGETIEISFSSSGGNAPVGSFTGMIDRITSVWTENGKTLKIEGYSPTIFMDSGPEFRAFSNMSLEAIVNKMMKDYRQKVSITGSTENISWTVQAQETDFQKLLRLADTSGKVFYYDGTKLHFGPLGGKEGNILLTHGVNVFSLKVSLNLAPLNFKIKAFEPSNNEDLVYESPNGYSRSNSLVKAAIAKSGNYPRPEIHLCHTVEQVGDLREVAHKICAKQAHELVTLSGTCLEPGLKVGSKISIDSHDEMLASTYIVLQVTHMITGENSYKNSFTAVPADHPYEIRMQKSRKPVCGPMPAVVRDIQDPKQLGRIRVELKGDKEKSLSPWVRFITPVASSGGIFLIPEVGDLVMVSFEDFNPEKGMFVLGSTFYGDATAQKWENGKKKGMAFKNVEFLVNEETGSLEIFAKSIKMKAEQDIEIDGGKRLIEKGDIVHINPK